jgi:hypothetical protein
MASVQFRGGAPVTSIHSFTAAFNAVAPGSASALAGLLTARTSAQRPMIPTRPWRPMRRSDAVANGDPVHGADARRGRSPACVSRTRRIPGVKATSSAAFAYVRFTVPAEPLVPDRGRFAEPGRGGQRVGLYRGGLVSRVTGPITLEAGDYVLAVNDATNSGTRTRASTCSSNSSSEESRHEFPIHPFDGCRRGMAGAGRGVGAGLCRRGARRACRHGDGRAQAQRLGRRHPAQRAGRCANRTTGLDRAAVRRHHRSRGCQGALHHRWRPDADDRRLA